MPPLEEMMAADPAGPQAAPMSNPTEQEGLKAQARQALQLAIKLGETALLPFGTQSEEGKNILNGIKAFQKVAGPSGGPDMNQAEVKMLAAQAGPTSVGGPSPGPGGMAMAGPGPMPI